MAGAITWLESRPTANDALGFPVAWITDKKEALQVIDFLIRTGG